MPGGSLPQTESREEALFVTEYTVHIKNAAVRIPEGGRIYDGTDQIELTYETEITQKEFPLSGTSSARKNRSVSEKDAAEFSPEALQRAVHREGEADPALPQIRVLCSAALDSPDAGKRKVKAVFRIETDEPERVMLDKKSLPENLTAEVLPRVLTVAISDGVKIYSEPADADHIRLTGASAVSVSGFAKDAAGRDLIPSGFRFQTVLVRCYEGALVLKKGADGALTGCAGSNYRFSTDLSSGCFRPGTVTVLPEAPVRGSDYEITGEEGAFLQQEDGSFLVRKGSSLTARPVQGSGYTDGMRSGPLQEDGIFTFRLRAVDGSGALAADSLETSVPYTVDSSVPEARFLTAGSGNGEETRFYKNTIPVRISVPEDPGSGLGTTPSQAAAGA